MHDNGIYYTWCCRKGVRPGGSNQVQIKMASSIAGEFVFVERSHYYIDSVKAELCGPAGPITSGVDVMALEPLPESWMGDDGVVAGAPVFDALSDEALVTLLEEMEG